MRIEKLRLKNFRNIEERALCFQEQFSVLIGDNGTGKTAILDTLAIAAGTYLLGIEGASSREIHRDDVRRVDYGENVEFITPVEIEAFGEIDSYPLQWVRTLEKIDSRTTKKRAGDIIQIARQHAQEVKENAPVNLPVIAYYGTGRLWAEDSGKNPYQKKGSRLSQGYTYSLDPKVSSRGFLSWYKTFEDEALKFGKNRELLEAFNDAIVSVVPNWEKISFNFSEDDLVGLYHQPDNEKTWMPFRLLSDGYRNIVGIVADIAYRSIKLNPHLGYDAVKAANGIVLIDELDLHLHPKWQKTIVNDLKETFPGIQFIATTHSPFIVQSLKRTELINLNQDQETEEDPFRKSIEEIAETEMEVPNVERSERFEEMIETAEKYFALIEEGKTSKNSEEVRKLKSKLDRLQEKYSEDPAYVALLKAERKTELNEE